jgi:Kef-type K+ transport system membrane component KefB
LLFASIALAAEKHHLHQAVSSLLFLALAIASIFLLLRFISRLRVDRLANWLARSGIFPVRAAMLVLLGYVALANNFGMETVAGAYAAGLAVAVLESATRDKTLEDRLTSIGSGFLIPVFFIASGITYDLHALTSDGGSMAQFILFCGAFLLIRLFPLFVYNDVLSAADLPALALMTAATLPLVVALSYLGVQSGQMRPDTATALVGAALITVTVFPSLAQWLRDQPPDVREAVWIERASATLANLGARCYVLLQATKNRIIKGRSGEL